jgi:hypothetical protein
MEEEELEYDPEETKIKQIVLTNYSYFHELMNDFPWDYVHKFMEKVDWKWYNSITGSYSVPSIWEMMSMVSGFWDEIMEYDERLDPTDSIASGGFTLIIDRETNLWTLKFDLKNPHEYEN